MDNSSESSEGRLIINLSHSNSRELDSGIQTISDLDISNDQYSCEGNTQNKNSNPVHQEVKAVTYCCHSDKVSEEQEKASCDISDNVNFGIEYQRASTPIPGKPGSSSGFDMEFMLEDKDDRLQSNTDEIITASNEQQIGSFANNKNESDRRNNLDQSDVHPRNMYCIPTDNITLSCNYGKAVSDSAITGTPGIQKHGCSLENRIPPVKDFQDRDLRCAMTKAKIMSMITSVKNPCLIKRENQVCFQKTAIDGSHPKPQYKRYPKPPYTYLGMIVVAIENSVNKQLTLSEIHDVLREFFPFFCGLYTGWKDSVRHNLSNNQCFYKVPKDPCDLKCRHHYWRVDLEKVPSEAFRRHESKDTMKGQYALYIHDHLGLPPVQLPSQKRRKLFLEEKRKNVIDQQKVNSNNNQEQPWNHDKNSVFCENRTDSVCSVAEPLSKRFRGDSESGKRDRFVRPVISDEAHLILNYISNSAITNEDTYSALQNLSQLCHPPAQYDPAVYAWQTSYYQVAGYPVPQLYNGMSPETACVNQVYNGMKPETACVNEVYNGMKPETACVTQVYNGMKPETARVTHVYNGMKPETVSVTQVYNGMKPETACVNQVYNGMKPETACVTQVYNGMTPETACVSQLYHGMMPETDYVPHSHQMLDNSYACRTLPHTISRDECCMNGGHSGYLPLQPSSTADSNPLETFADYASTYTNSHQQ
ncbi:hypothetical protein ACJMK2_010130 [Sinanodonta woodiana]|uniref:Fork-head domain-containing protein n=1 Tax=Sinanodonta woodiana TaxID=1069815 RepID=A0ABD3VFV8_SINWO